MLKLLTYLLSRLVWKLRYPTRDPCFEHLCGKPQHRENYWCKRHYDLFLRDLCLARDRDDYARTAQLLLKLNRVLREAIYVNTIGRPSYNQVMRFNQLFDKDYAILEWLAKKEIETMTTPPTCQDCGSRSRNTEDFCDKCYRPVCPACLEAVGNATLCKSCLVLLSPQREDAP